MYSEIYVATYYSSARLVIFLHTTANCIPRAYSNAAYLLECTTPLVHYFGSLREFMNQWRRAQRTSCPTSCARRWSRARIARHGRIQNLSFGRPLIRKKDHPLNVIMNNLMQYSVSFTAIMSLACFLWYHTATCSLFCYIVMLADRGRATRI